MRTLDIERTTEHAEYAATCERALAALLADAAIRPAERLAHIAVLAGVVSRALDEAFAEALREQTLSLAFEIIPGPEGEQ